MLAELQDRHREEAGIRRGHKDHPKRRGIDLRLQPDTRRNRNAGNGETIRVPVRGEDLQRNDAGAEEDKEKAGEEVRSKMEEEG